MAGTSEFAFVDYTGEPDVDVKQSLPALRQHFLYDFLRRQREEQIEEDNGSSRAKFQPIPKLSSVRWPSRARNTSLGFSPSDSSIYSPLGTSPAFPDLSNSSNCPFSSLRTSPALTDLSSSTESSYQTESSCHTTSSSSTGSHCPTTSSWVADLSSIDLTDSASFLHSSSSFGGNLASCVWTPPLVDAPTYDQNSSLPWTDKHETLAAEHIATKQRGEIPSRTSRNSLPVSWPKFVVNNAYRPVLGSHLLTPLLEEPQSPKDERRNVIDTNDAAVVRRKSNAMMLREYSPSNLDQETRALKQEDRVLCAPVTESSYAGPSQHSEETFSDQASSGSAIDLDRSASPSASDRSRLLSDTDSLTSSGGSVIDVDDLLLELEVSRLRSWLLGRFNSCQSSQRLQLQYQLMYRHHNSSASQNQSTGSSPDSIFETPSSSGGASSSKNPDGSKRGRDEKSDQDKQQDKRRRVTPDEPSSRSASIPRLACLYNRYDPIMYRSNPQTLKKFEICGSHDFQNMNKLYEHLKRVHSDQPLQCPRCTCTSFESSEELQAHQAAPEPCTLIPLNTVKRIQWISHDKRKALQSAVNRRHRGCTDEEKWKFAYGWLFPDTKPEEIPCPYLHDPVISIVSSITDDFERRLRELIRSSSDLDDLEGRIPTIRGQFLAQYGISINEVERDLPSLTRSRTASSSPVSGRLTTTTISNVADANQPYLGDETYHDLTTVPSNSETDVNGVPPGTNTHQDVSIESLFTVSNALTGLQNHEAVNFEHDVLNWNDGMWDHDQETTDDMMNGVYAMDQSKYSSG